MEKKTDTNPSNSTISRRHLIRTGAPLAGVLVLGAGSVGAESVPGRVGAPGKGGEAIVERDDYRADSRFRIVDFAPDVPRKAFQCEGRGRTISFPAWEFEYLDDTDDANSPSRYLYTRDNNVDTDPETEYQWKPLDSGAKECGSGGELIQTPFITGR